MSPRLPPSHRGGAYASRTHELCERYFLRHRFAWTRKLCGPIYSGYAFRIDRQIDWLKRMPVSPGASPDGQDASTAVELCIGFTTPKINQAYILKEGIEHLRCGLEMLIAEGLTRGWTMPGV